MRKVSVFLTLCLILFTLSACKGSSGGTLADEAGGDTGGKNEQGTETHNAGSGHTGPVKLVFATVNPSAQLKASVKKYESQHPNVTIELTSTQSTFKDITSQEANIEKYVTSTNTAMLAGKGPDLLEMDLLPADKYANRHLLVDLNDMMKQDASFKKSDYFANVLDNSEIGGGLYTMPISFYLNGLLGDADAIGKTGVQIDDRSWTWDDFSEIAKQLAQKGEIKNAFLSTTDYLLGEMVSENYSLYVDAAKRKAKFDSPAFIGMLERIKTMFDDGVAKKIDDRTGKNAPAYFQETPIRSLPDYLLVMNSSFSGHAKLYTKPHASELGAGGYFQTSQNIGINAKSPFKDEAWNFITFLVSEEEAAVTSDNAASGYSISDISFSGFPISKTAFDKQVEQIRKAGSATIASNGPADGGTIKADSALLDQLEGYLTGAVHAIGNQSKIIEFVTGESKAFFNGQKSAEEVAKLIQNKVNLYLNE